jgi:oxygen-dependent protoporphyrinogen oxidase
VSEKSATSALPRRVVVVGGGVAGLVVAFRLAQSDAAVTLVEAADRLGGQLATSYDDGFVTEQGAEGFVASSRAMDRLAADVGLSGSLIGQSVGRSFAYTDARLVELAPGEAATMLGFQVPKSDVGGGVRTFRLGMQELVDRLEQELARRVVVRRSAVSSLVPSAAGTDVVFSAGGTVGADAVVLAVDARSIARLVDPLVSSELGPWKGDVASSVTVSLGYRRDQIAHALDATGFVVPRPADANGLRACTFVSSKFAGRAPAGRALLRAFFRPETADHGAPDSSWAHRAHAALAGILGIDGEPTNAWVSRWNDALPVFARDHGTRASPIEQSLAARSVFLAGSAAHGAGIDAAVRSAERVADALARASS